VQEVAAVAELVVLVLGMVRAAAALGHLLSAARVQLQKEALVLPLLLLTPPGKCYFYYIGRCSPPKKD
jgi:hypothetical protein